MSELVDEPAIEPADVPDYLYRADVRSIVDGDTFEVRIDLGFDTAIVETVRTRDIDTREISFVETDTKEYERGKRHLYAFERWVAETQYNCVEETEWPFYLYSQSYERGVYGRIVGDIWSKHHGEWASRYLFDRFDDVALYGKD